MANPNLKSTKQLAVEEIERREASPVPREAYVELMKSLKILNDLRSGRGKQQKADKEANQHLIPIHCRKCREFVEFRTVKASLLCEACKSDNAIMNEASKMRKRAEKERKPGTRRYVKRGELGPA